MERLCSFLFECSLTYFPFWLYFHGMQTQTSTRERESMWTDGSLHPKCIDISEYITPLYSMVKQWQQGLTFTLKKINKYVYMDVYRRSSMLNPYFVYCTHTTEVGSPNKTRPFGFKQLILCVELCIPLLDSPLGVWDGQ